MFSRDSLVSGDIRFMRIFAGVRKFLCKFSLDLRMHVSSDTVLVILQITKIVILWHGKFEIRYQAAGCSKKQCWLQKLIIMHRAVLRAILHGFLSVLATCDRVSWLPFAASETDSVSSLQVKLVPSRLLFSATLQCSAVVSRNGPM